MRSTDKRLALRRWWIAGGVLTVTACGWFGDESCEEGAERCDGKKILTCIPNYASGSTSTYSWKKSGSCASFGGALACYEEDGLAFCGPERLDGGVDGGLVRPGSSGPITPFADKPPAESARWMRLDVTREGEQLMLVKAREAMLSSAPAAPAAGQVAAVSYDGAGKPLSAAMVAVPDEARATSVWLKAEGASTVRLLQRGGASVAQLALAPAAIAKAAPTARLGRAMQALGEDLPPTLTIATAGKTVSVFFADTKIPLTAVDPSAEQLAIVTAALRRLSPYTASLVAEVAFTADVGAFDLLTQKADGGTQEIDLTIDAGAETSPNDAGVWRASPPPLSLVERRRLAIIGATLVVNVEDWALASYREDPLGFALELTREFSLSLVRLTSAALDPFSGPGANFAFPGDFPKDIEALIRERISPLLASRGETFSGVWGGLHGLAVEAGLASSYFGWPISSDVEAVRSGFAAGRGAAGPAADFAEYVARATVPETWGVGPCAAIRSAPLDELEPRLLVHVAKLEALWGLGMLTSRQIEACVGQLALNDAAQGVVAHKPNGEQARFDQDVSARVDPYLHGQTQVAFTAAQVVAPGEELSATFTLATHGVPTGVMRLTSVSSRENPEVGAGFLFANSLRYTRSEATAGLMLVTRVDDERIEAHALMVRQGAKEPFFDTKVFPLVTARYDVPEDERALVEEAP